VGSEHLLASLRAAVEAAPDDVELRLHLAELLIGAGEREEAVREAAQVLVRDPQNERALRLVSGGRDVVEPQLHQEAENDTDEILRGLDEQLSDIAPPMFADGPVVVDKDAWDIEAPRIRLADVGGMEDVKARLEAAFLAR